MRADALRNIDAILEAAHRCLGDDPDASMGDIAKAAGVGRVTLYGHFGSRAELVEAVVQRALATFDSAMSSLDLDGDPRQALARLVASSWQPTAESANLLVAVQLTDDRGHADAGPPAPAQLRGSDLFGAGALPAGTRPRRRRGAGGGADGGRPDRRDPAGRRRLAVDLRPGPRGRYRAV